MARPAPAIKYFDKDILFDWKLYVVTLILLID